MRFSDVTPVLAGLFVVSGLSLVMSPSVAVATEAEYEMTTYQFVLLHTGPDRTELGEAESRAKQQAHLDYLQKLIDDDRAIIVGPVHDAGDLRGIVVLDVGSVEKADEVMAADPWIAAGKLAAEIHPWWAAKGILQKPSDILDHRQAHLGLLKRPADAPDFDDDKLQELQEGHMANIQAMADAGDLLIAGPMGDDGVLRGIFVFRTTDTARVEGLVANDPSIQARRLEMNLYRWTVPRESFPEP